MEKEAIKWLKIAFVGIAFVAMLAVFSVYRLGDRMMLWSFMLFSVIYLFSVVTCPKALSRNNKDVFVFFVGWFIVYLISAALNSSMPDGTSWIYLLYATMFLQLRRDIQWQICESFVKALSVFLTIAIVEFAIYQIIGIGIVIGNVSRPENQGPETFVHLIFNMISEKYDIVRFQSLANEPGLLGTLCGLLLYSTGEDKKNRYPFYVFIVSGILTYSLAFYVLAAIYFFSKIKSIKSLKFIIPLLIVGGIAIYTVRDNIGELIIDRIESGDADNRSSWTLDLYFAKAWASGELLTGVGAHNFPDEIEGSNAGAKVWIIQFGFIGFIIIFFTYIFTYIRRKRGKMKWEDYVFLIAFWASFYQRQTIIDSYTLMAFFLMPLVTSDYDFNTIKNGRKSINNNTSVQCRKLPV